MTAPTVVSSRPETAAAAGRGRGGGRRRWLRAGRVVPLPAGTLHPISLRTAGIFNERRELTVLDPDVFGLERITTPTLVIHGERDTLQPFSNGQHTVENIPGARLVALEDGGHMPVKYLAQIRDEIAAFLDASAPPAA